MMRGEEEKKRKETQKDLHVLIANLLNLKSLKRSKLLFNLTFK